MEIKLSGDEVCAALVESAVGRSFLRNDKRYDVKVTSTEDSLSAVIVVEDKDRQDHEAS